VRSLVHGYDELKLRIERQDSASYRVLASTRLAEAAASFELPFNELQVENFILKVSRPRGRRRIDSSAIDDARMFGGGLFTALFSGQVLGLYRDALAHARREDRGVRLTLCLSASPELIDVPWEYLFDDPDFLAVSAFTPVVRYLDLPRAHRPLSVAPPLRLLGVISSPAEYERLDVERERDNLERALSGLTETGAVELQWLERPTLGALLKTLQVESFHGLHYIGHGTFDRGAERGVLLFENDEGWAQPVSGDKLGMILHDFSSLRLAVLNACEGARTARTDPFAGVAGSLVQRDIPAVVAMQFEISDEAAIVFSRGFYEPLAAGSPVDESLAAARLAMLAERSDDIEWGTPVLFMRVADGRIFDRDDEPESDASGSQPHRNGGGSRGRLPRRSGRPPSIVINYRREDTGGHALLLADRLGRHFGHEHVHHTGADRSEITHPTTRGSTPVVLALIGPAWAASLKLAGASRHTEDVPRREIESALRDRPDSVLPVLIDAAMPDAEALPRSLRGLCRREPTTLRHESFDSDLDALIARLEHLADAIPSPAAAEGARPAAGTVVRTAASVAPPPADSLPAAAGIARPYHDHYVDVVAAMLDGTVVPLLGPGVLGAPASVDHLAAPLAAQFEAPPSGLAEVAQRVAVTLGERRLYTAFRELVAAQSEPTEVHRFLAALPGLMRRSGSPPRHQLIISANYDSGLERAFEDANEPFDYAVYLAGDGWFVHVPWGEHASEPEARTILEPKRYVGFPIDDDGELERTIIVKIHGGADGGEGGVAWRNNYVVTEDHYIDYLPTQNIQDHLPIQILDKLTGSRCLFLGYPLRSWNARVFLRRIWRGMPISENSWAIEQGPDLVEKASWSAIGRVELLTASLPDYVSVLRSILLQTQGAN
jgi:CHAT domain/SIR2-like domain